MSSPNFTIHVVHRRRNSQLQWSSVDVAQVSNSGTEASRSRPLTAPAFRGGSHRQVVPTYQDIGHETAPAKRRGSVNQVVPVNDGPGGTLHRHNSDQSTVSTVSNGSGKHNRGPEQTKLKTDPLISSTQCRLPVLPKQESQNEVNGIITADSNAPGHSEFNVRTPLGTMRKPSLDNPALNDVRSKIMQLNLKGSDHPSRESCASGYSSNEAAKAARKNNSPAQQSEISQADSRPSTFELDVANGRESPLPLLSAKSKEKKLQGKLKLEPKQKPKQDDVPAWRKDRTGILRRVTWARGWTAICAMSGTLLALAQNEIILRAGDPRSDLMNLLKTGAFLSSMVCLGLIYRVYYLHKAYEKLADHVRHFGELERIISVWEIFSQPFFWSEVFFQLVVVPPFISGEFGTFSQSNFVLYRAETMAACFAICKVYLLWRWWCDMQKSSIPKRFTIESFTKMEFDDGFVVKSLLEGWRAFSTIAIIWTIFLMAFGYWFRSAEMTACLFDSYEHKNCEEPQAREWTLDGATYFEKSNDLYLQNAIWAMFVVSTTVGYGDIYPTTHFGRFVTLAMALFGTIFAAIMTAALTLAVQWTQEEHWVLLLCKKAHGKEMLPQRASALIGKWWRLRKRSSPQRRHNLSKIRSSFQAAYASQHCDLEKARADIFKVEQMYTRGRYCVSALKDINQRILQVGDVGSSVYLATQNAASVFLARKSKGSTDKTASDLGRPQAHENVVSQHQKQVPEDHGTNEEEDYEFGVPYSRQSSTANLDQNEESTSTYPRLASSQDLHKDHGQHGSSDHNPISKIDAPLEASIPTVNAKVPISRRRSDSITRSFSVNPQLARARMLASVSQSSMDPAQPATVASKAPLASDKMRRRVEDAILPRKKKWWRDHNQIDQKLVQIRQILAPLSLLGTLCAVIQNELIFVNYDPQHILINLAKAGNSIITIICVLGIYRATYLKILFKTVQTHLHEFGPLTTKVTALAVLQSKSFWLQAIVVAIHCPPGYTGETGMFLLSNFILYRYETLFCVWNFTRVFLLWNAVIDWLVNDLPMRHTFAGYANIQIGSSFAVKRALNSWYSTPYIATVWTFSCVLLAYMFRSVEISACLLENSDHPECGESSARHWSIYGTEFDKINDMFLYNSIWFMLITTTTVGLGDMLPTTHIGRGFAVASTIVGIMCTTLLTASLANMLQWTNKETRAKAIILREEARQQKVVLAVNIISLWWRTRGGKKLSRSQRKVNKKQLFRQWQNIKMFAASALDETGDISDKIEMTKTVLQHVEGQIDKAATNLWSNDGVKLLEQHANWEKKADNEEMAAFWDKQVQNRRTSLMSQASSQNLGQTLGFE